MREDIVTMPVPIPDYANPLKYAQWQSGGGTWYQGPSARIKRSLSSVASAGAILPVPPPFPNASYSIQFYGPSITCETLDNSTSTLSDLFSHNVSDFTSHLGAQLGYLGFVPSCHTSLDDSCSHNDTTAATAALQQELNYTLTRDQSLLDPTTHGSPKVYVVVPELFSYTNFTTITCEPHNSSYSGEITFNNGQQAFNITKTKMEPGPDLWETCVNESHDNDGVIDYTRPSLCASLAAHASIWDALVEMLLGTIVVSHYGYATSSRTAIMTSILIQTREIYSKEVVSRIKEPLTIANMTMAEALEEVFTNTTLSLLSDSYFL